MDASLAAVALALLSPLFLILALAVKALLGSPILFRQLRPGLNGKPFEILKFRTMAEIYDGKASLLPDEKRITRFGRFLRNCNLDEFPELINVLKAI